MGNSFREGPIRGRIGRRAWKPSIGSVKACLYSNRGDLGESVIADPRAPGSMVPNPE